MNVLKGINNANIPMNIEMISNLINISYFIIITSWSSNVLLELIKTFRRFFRRFSNEKSDELF